MKFLRIMFKIIIALLLATGLYFMADFAISAIPAKISKNDEAPKNITILLQTNGVHTDLVLPKTNHIKDWQSFFSQSIDPAGLQKAQFISFGWGDRAFYMNTPEWSDLTPKTAISAALGLGPSAMHVGILFSVVEDDQRVAIPISDHDYRLLVHFILESFELQENKLPIKIRENHPYPATSTFFEANRRYNLLYTCNTWTNQALKTANQPAALWTAMDYGIFQHYNR